MAMFDSTSEKSLCCHKKKSNRYNQKLFFPEATIFLHSITLCPKL